MSCTLREDLLPLLVRLARDPDVAHVVLLLDPGVEVEATCEALHGLVPEGLDRPVADLFAMRGVVAVLDPRLANARYGSYLRASLPDFWYTTDRNQARRSLAAIDAAAKAAQ